MGPERKFTPTEGCLEHNFMLQEVLDDARRNSKQTCIAWLDLANAFPSIPHQSLFYILQKIGLTEQQLSLIQDLYTGSTTAIRHSSGLTNPIPFNAGVRQGCPLSPLLLNLAMEMLIRPVLAQVNTAGYSLRNTRINILAYADDLCILARTPQEFQLLLNTLQEAAQWIGLTFKPSKCGSLHMLKNKAQKTKFFLNKSPIPILDEGDSSQHLGVPTGARVD
ncbi:Retrovirus-related Pol polyprotein from type-2 retrotransposable element R2DM [Frankliniella fusca]|uniref:Retrovirus-related Pol polyprotein from type-2 retrotransposable element R2DM n=1 Tax=Frankliniella fusca TaxID=407009 RepID=A0AAE1LAP0_9NEOP|nr:Retrovirus-related Pol polyprotein from type-2 retrotransposable element R2DM [Frankliniella fusca]